MRKETNDQNNIIDANQETCNEEVCQICNEQIEIGEIIYYCLCSYFFHPNCYSYLQNHELVKVKGVCESCGSNYNSASFKIKFANDILKNNIKLDTNLHDIDNYDELSCFAFHSTPENIAEILIKKQEEKSNYDQVTDEKVKRMPLSPINITTPFSFKSKKQGSSNNVTDYLKMQSKLNFNYNRYKHNT